MTLDGWSWKGRRPPAFPVEMKLAAGTLCMQTLLTRSRVLLQTENVHIAQIDVHEYDSMALP